MVRKKNQPKLLGGDNYLLIHIEKVLQVKNDNDIDDRKEKTQTQKDK